MSPSLRAGCTHRFTAETSGPLTGTAFLIRSQIAVSATLDCTVCSEMGPGWGVWGAGDAAKRGQTLHRSIQVASDTCHPRAGQDLLDTTTQSPRGPSEQISACLLVNNQLAQSMSTHPRQWCSAPALQRSTLPKLNSISADRCFPTWSAACAARAYIE